MDMSTRSENHKNEDLLGFLGKWKPKITNPILGRKILWSFWAIQRLNFKLKMGPQNPADPKSNFFRRDL